MDTPRVLVLVAVTLVSCAQAGALSPCCRLESPAATGKTAGCVSLTPPPVNDANVGTATHGSWVAGE